MLSDICNIATVNLGWYRRSFRSLIWGDEESAVFCIMDNYIFIKLYEKGYIYLQSLPSMIPPIVLKPNEGEKVLDLTAAPGSKTTQIAALMNNKGYILANELDKIRCER